MRRTILLAIGIGACLAAGLMVALAGGRTDPAASTAGAGGSAGAPAASDASVDGGASLGAGAPTAPDAAVAAGDSSPAGPPAATYHVGPTGTDEGSCEWARSAATPRATIRAGLACAAPGDTVEVAGGEYVETVEAWPAGAPGRAVTLRARAGEVVRWRGDGGRPAVRLVDRSHVRIAGFRFEGTTARNTVVIQNASMDKADSPVEGIEILRNTFVGNGDPMERSEIVDVLSLGRPRPGPVPSVRIEGNVFDGNYGIDVRLSATTDAEVVRNEMKNGRAARLREDWIHRGVFLGGEDRRKNNNRRNLIAENRIHDFRREAGAGRGRYRPIGIKCDVNGDSATIRDNLIHDLEDGHGIFLESRCDDNLVERNVIYRAGDGIAVGSKSTGTAYGNRIVGNTIYDARSGISLRKAANTVVQHNIVARTTEAAVVESDSSMAYGGNQWRFNLYHRPDDRRLASRGRDPNDRRPHLDFASWVEASGDEGSMSKDPMFESVSAGAEDFRLRPGSPALGKGQGAADLGALPKPR